MANRILGTALGRRLTTVGVPLKPRCARSEQVASCRESEDLGGGRNDSHFFRLSDPSTLFKHCVDRSIWPIVVPTRATPHAGAGFPAPCPTTQHGVSECNADTCA